MMNAQIAWPVIRSGPAAAAAGSLHSSFNLDVENTLASVPAGTIRRSEAEVDTWFALAR
jgi:hypothetical protein